MEKTMHRDSVVTPQICLCLLDVNLEKALAKCVTVWLTKEIHRKGNFNRAT